METRPNITATRAQRVADELSKTRQAFLDLTPLWEWIKGLRWKFRNNIQGRDLQWMTKLKCSCMLQSNEGFPKERVSICNAWLPISGLGKLSEVPVPADGGGHRWSRLRLAARRECWAWDLGLWLVCQECVASWLMAPRNSLPFMNHAEN